MSERVRLRPTTDDDLDYVLALESDPDTSRFIAPQPREAHRALCGRERAVRHWIVEEPKTAEPVGFVIVQEFDEPRVQLRRMAISRKGEGFGRATLRAVVRATFARPEARVLWLDVFDFNDRAIALYESEGFVEVKRVRAAEACGVEEGTAIVMELSRRSAD